MNESEWAADLAEPPMKRRGIHCIFDVRLRCEREGRHWIWKGALGSGHPIANIHGYVYKGIRITAVALGRDAERQPHQRWFAKCGGGLCMSPECLRLGTHKEAHAAAKRGGRLTRIGQAYENNLRARRQRPDVKPDWMRRWAIESPQSDVEVAHALGINRATVGVWRRAARPPSVGPFELLLRLAA